MPYQVYGKRHVRVTEEDGKRVRHVFNVGEVVEPTEQELNAFPDRFRFFPENMSKEDQVDADNVMPGQGQYEAQNHNPLRPEAVEHQSPEVVNQVMDEDDDKEEDKDGGRKRGRPSSK